MTEEKKKAVELIEKFHQHTAKFHQDNAGNGWETDLYASKQCALICVETILELDAKNEEDESKWMCIAYNHQVQFTNYWQEVRNEIINYK